MDDDDIPTLVESDVPLLTEDSQTSAVAEHKTVPLTIICGFLGAGKSTSIKYDPTFLSIIMNDFGDTADIEAKTINVSSPDEPESEPAEEFLELANGCLCCSIKDIGIASIEKLMQRKGAFDHILLETTGLADPGPIASMFWQNEEFAQGLGKDIHLDGVVCVVDAVFGKKQMEEDHASNGIGESLRQIACADVILLNKSDLAPPPELDNLQELVSHINPAATIYRTTRGEIDLRYIMGIDAYSARRVLPKETLAGHSHASHPDSSCSEAGHDHTHERDPHHYEIRGISSLQVSCPPLKQSKLQQIDEWIRTVLWENRLPDDPQGSPPVQILRCKGIFRVEGGETYVLQGVRSLYEISSIQETPSADMGLPGEGKLVFIGKGLEDRVRRSLETLLQ
ncbi:unnamed protein product [Somion occarium]|uniref:COBW domain-containing protein 1 n=1 Tax=Somion occarium TaxID=3059160 RepID=A0ABP1E278_9APHY